MNIKTKRHSILAMLIPIIIVFFLSMGMFAWTVFTYKTQTSTAYADASHSHDGITFNAWTNSGSLPSSGSIYLTTDVNISSTLNVSGILNLCLNGHGIKLNGSGSVIRVGEGSTLKLYDCNTTTEHRYSVSNPATNGAGVATVNDLLTSNYQTFTGGYITGGYLGGGYQYGAGINLEGDGATLYMYGGTIIGNRLTAGSTGGGGVCLQDWNKSGGFYMYGGSIIGNTSNYGGGVYVRSGTMELVGGNISKNVAKDNIGGGILVFGENSLIVKGGSISNNLAVHGGAVEASGGGTVTISGGNFTNNIATGNGGALTNQRTDGNTSPANFKISGAPVFSGNKAGGLASDVYLCNTAVLNLTAAMTNTTKIGIRKASNTGVFTSGWSTFMEGKNPADYFVSDGGYDLVVINNEACVHQHTYGDLVAKVDATCDADGMAAYYHCAECGMYFDENKDETAYDDLIIHTRGHAYQYHARVDATCTTNGVREHFTCARCGKIFNTNKQVVEQYKLNIGASGHKYDTDSIEFHLTPDESSYYKWKATVSYSCANCGEVFEKYASMTAQSATWNVDYHVKAYVELYTYQINSVPTQLEYNISSSYIKIYSEPIINESYAGTATKNKWTAWEYDDRLPNTLQPSGSEGWYLTKDVTLTDTWTVPVNGLKLCLNGHAIVGNFSTPKSVIYVPNKIKFELYEYNYDDTHYYYIGKTVTDSHGNELNFVGQLATGEDDPNYIAAARKGSFKGGYITGGSGRTVGSTTYGGAVYVDGTDKYYNSGEFIMYGATLFGNYADYGGGVFVATRGYADLQSGNVIGNQAGNQGGGVYANERVDYNSSYRNQNAGARTYSAKILHNTAGQSGSGFGGGLAGWIRLGYGTVQGNAAIGASAKGGAVYGLLNLEHGPTITENYTTGVGPGVYVTTYNMSVDGSAYFRIYGNLYASTFTTETISVTGHGDLYFASGYVFTIRTDYPPYSEDGCLAYVEMQNGTGNFTTQWINNSYSRYYQEIFAARPGYRIALSGNTLSVQTGVGDYNVDTSKQIVIYTNYYYLNGNTTSPTTYTTDANRRYVFSGTRTLTSNISIYGNHLEGSDIYLRFNNVDLTAPSNNGYIFYAYPYYGPLNIHIELVGDSVLRSSGIYTAFYGGSNQYPLNIYFTGSGTITFVDAAGSSNAFSQYSSGREAHVQLGGEDISVYEIVKEKIAEIGLEVTFTREIKERIDVARAAYDALDDSLKEKITNYSVLVAAELAYKIAAVQGAIDMIEAIPDVYTIESNASIFLAREAYDALDNEELKGLLETEDPQAFVYNRQKLFDAEASMICPMKATAEGCEVDYDGEAHGIIVTPEVEGTTIKYGTQEGEYTLDECPTYTDAGTYTIYYEVTKTKYTTVIGSAVVTISPIDVTVTITGNNSIVDYDSEEHTVSGYDVAFNTALYTENDFTFSGNATASQTNAGTTYMGLAASQFANTSANFATVMFTVADGYITVEPIDATVIITGHQATVDYDGEEHTVSGYDAEFSTDVYTAADFTFSGTDTASLTNIGIVYMKLNESQFANTNTNFATITFIVADGYITVVPVDAKIIIAPKAKELTYNGALQKLVIEGEVDGGTLLYALGTDENNEPNLVDYTMMIPSAEEAGNYYVWYRVDSDANHIDLAPVCMKVVLAEDDWTGLRGVVYQHDGETLISGVLVSLVKGNQTVDSVITDGDGIYRFTVPHGVYNVVADYEGTTETVFVALFDNTEQDIVMPDGKTESILQVNSDDENGLGVAVGGLDEEAQAVREENQTANNVSVVMTVEQKTEETATSADYIIDGAKDKSLAFFEIKVEKTVDSVTTVIDETNGVMEIVIPYEKINKRGLIVYSYHDSKVRTFVESNTKEDGTFRVDKENGLVYVYANKFSTYAIGYTPYYRVQTSVSLGSYNGKISVEIKNNADSNIVFALNNVDANNIVFPDVPKGEYTMTITWEDGIKNTLKMTLTVGPKTVLSAITEKETQREEQEAQPYTVYTDTTDDSEILYENDKIETGVIVSSEYEAVASEQVSAIGKAQGLNREVVFIPRKREYKI